ncbi:SDR family oxidoreductase [Dehalococcoidia bacterium]|nr:SDR family oxidoreductase [Dehalococcoidia bacterium]
MSFAIDPDLLGLVDQVALVTGGGGIGMGRAHALQLARAGCHVVVADIDIDGGCETVRQVEALGREAVFTEADVTKESRVHDMVATTVKAFGRLDIAVNHVGGTAGGVGPFLDYTMASWHGIIERNLTTTVMCCQAEALAMIKQEIEGRIINVSSSSGFVGAPNVAAYGVAKAGVIHLTKTLSIEFARYGIRVNCIIPGTHDNEGQRLREVDPNTREGMKRFRELAALAPPMGRLGDPMDTAGLTVFFASKLSSYVTGHSLLSDGGLIHTTARPAVGLEIEPEALKRLREDG